MNLNNYVTSLIRTWVPIAIGTALAWFSSTINLVIDQDTQTGLTAAFVGFVIALYYAIIRKVEIRYPQFGWLLGMAKAPGYAPGEPPKESPGINPDEGSVPPRLGTQSEPYKSLG